ncbi:MAG: hypothetical protein Ta2A_08710 [Treponemataceae bacterium]|nr:MAG: hypothetical protein Ta2A_08710 [Treponemataceae bacterium]
MDVNTIEKGTIAENKIIKNMLAAALIVLLIAHIPLAAQEWTVTDSVTEGNMIVTTLSDSAKHTSRVIAAHDLTPSEIEIISACLDAIWAIPGLEGAASSVSIDNSGRIRLIVYPESLTYLGTQFLPHLPGGLGFYYSTALFYDITLKVNESVAKVRGAYISPDDFLDSLSLALLTPDRFSYDDELLHRIDRLEAALMAVLKARPVAAAIDPPLVIAIIALYNENSAIQPKAAVKILKDRGIKATEKDVKAVLQVMIGVY